MISTAFDQALAGIATWLLLGCLGWAVLLGTAALVESGTSGRVRATVWVGCPPRLRRALLSGLGLALAGGAATPALALTPTRGAAAPPPASAVDESVHDGRDDRGGRTRVRATLPVPARPVSDVDPRRGGVLVVRPGDSLWRLAAERAGPRAPDGEVARLVRRLHQRNLGVIGPDPDLLHPGQRLAVPTVRSQRPHPDPEERP